MSQKMIHSNGFGYIAKCRCCHDVQCCMGNVIFTFDRHDFRLFREGFFKSGGVESAQIHREGSIKRYVIETGFSDLKLSLSKKEYAQASDLLNMAELEFQLEDQLNG